MKRTPCIRKSLALLLAALMVFATLPATATAASASDIAGHWAEDTLDKWSDLGWFTGDGAGVYRPNASITRAEFAALVNRMKGYSGESADIAKYKDVSAGAWYYGAISAALAEGYLTGVGADAMAPTRPITRQEAIAIIARIEGVTSSDTAILSAATDGGDVAAWARESVAASIAAGLVAGSDGKLNPTDAITRAESVVLMDRVYANVKTYALAGTYGPAPTSEYLNAAAINIAGAGVQLHKAAVSGDLTITAAVGDGDVYLEGVTVNGKLNVRGGGSNSVRLNDCSIRELILEKPGVRVVLSGASSVSSARSEGAGSIVALENGAKIETLTLAIPNAQLNLEAGASITTLNAEAAGAKIETQAGASIGTANLSAATEITGAGSIATANITTNGV
ncbi:MAG: S-layer homology domain-containing protein, partial [Clostridiales Family XIII bacterium]|nr:S-layer homology domain-containing protein [Clostridiales Family XIII bacterium]